MALPLIDLSEERSRLVIVDREADRYLGQPDTVLLADGQTILMAIILASSGYD